MHTRRMRRREMIGVGRGDRGWWQRDVFQGWTEKTAEGKRGRPPAGGNWPREDTRGPRTRTAQRFPSSAQGAASTGQGVALACGDGVLRRRDDAGRDRRAHRSGTRLPTSRSAHAGPPLRSPRRSLSAAGRGRRHRRPLSPACLMLLTAHPATHTRIIFVGN